MGKKKSKIIIKEAERLGFKDFQKYTFFGQRKGGAVIKKLTALSELQKEIVQRLGFDERIYLQLET